MDELDNWKSEFPPNGKLFQAMLGDGERRGDRAGGGQRKRFYFKNWIGTEINILTPPLPLLLHHSWSLSVSDKPTSAQTECPLLHQPQPQSEPLLPPRPITGHACLQVTAAHMPATDQLNLRFSTVDCSAVQSCRFLLTQHCTHYPLFIFQPSLFTIFCSHSTCPSVWCSCFIFTSMTRFFFFFGSFHF